MSVSVTAELRWSDALLDAMREETDPAADQVVAVLFGTGQVEHVNELLAVLMESDESPMAALPAVVREYLATSAALPPWADPQKITVAERVFRRYGPAIIAILHCYSLPFYYASAKGVQVMALTSRLYTNPARRATETAQMLIDVMRPCGLSDMGTGIRAAQKFRLMNAAVRLLMSGHDGWKPEFGRPINQEDLAATLLSLSWAIIDGLRRLGYEVTPKQAEAYLHCWKVAAYLLGIRPELLPIDFANAAMLAGRIQQRHHAASEEGRMMTQALIEMMQSYLPGNALNGLPASFIRYLLGADASDMLGVPVCHPDRDLTCAMRLAAYVETDVVSPSNELARAHELFARALINGVALVGSGSKTAFTIPADLLNAWGVNWAP